MAYESDGGTVGSQENSPFNSGGITLGINIEKTDDGIPCKPSSSYANT